MGMAVQKDIDVSRQSVRWNMLQTESQPAPRNIKNQRPVGVAVAISTNNNHARSDCLQFVKDHFRANISKVPDLVGVFGHLDDAFRQAIMRIGQNEHVLSFSGFCVHNRFGFPSRPKLRRI